MLQRFLVFTTFVLCAVAIWLTLSQPNTAFAQNPTPAVSNQMIGPAPTWKPGDPFEAPMPMFPPPGESFATPQITIGPISTDNKPLESHTPYPTPPVDDPTPTTSLSEQLDFVFWLGFKALVGGAVVIGLVFMASMVYIQWKERRPRKRKRGKPRFQTRD